MAIVSTGQITIVDTNDARPITAYMTTNPGTQQVYNPDNAVQFTPSWFTTALRLSPKVFVGGTGAAEDVTNQLGNRKFTLSVGGTAIANSTTSTNFVNNTGGAITNNTPFTVETTSTTATYLDIKGNLKESVASFVVYFEGDYTDPVTKLVTHVITSVTLNTVKTGSNAVYVTLRGSTSIEQSTSGYKNVIAISADLVRGSGVDVSGVTYKWFANNAATQITTATMADAATKYGFKTVASPNLPTAVNTDIGVGIPATAATSATNTLVISENAVIDQDVLRVDIYDSTDAKTYTSYFTVYDISDPYDLKVISSTGDKLQNGQGSTALTPLVYYGASRIEDLTDWKFTWYFYDKNGKRGAFVDSTIIPADSTTNGITANTAGATASFTCAAVTAGKFVAGDIIKCVTSAGDAYFYEVGAASTANTVVIRAPITTVGSETNTWLTYTAPTANQFVGGELWGCVRRSVGSATFVAGSGYTNGTYNIAATGGSGGGSGTSVRVVVSGGKITSATVISAGNGYTAPPTVTFPAGMIGSTGTGGSVTLALQPFATHGGTITSAGGAAITVTGDDIDVKGTITCQADRP